MCLAVDSAAGAQDVLGEQAFDLLLLDIAMPVKSGMDYLPELISQYPDLAVVMLTGEADVATLAVAQAGSLVRDRLSQENSRRVATVAAMRRLSRGGSCPARRPHSRRAGNRRLAL